MNCHGDTAQTSKLRQLIAEGKTREEILASQQEAASAGAVNPRSPFERLQDPAKQFEDHVVAPQNEPERVETKVDEGWLL